LWLFYYNIFELGKINLLTNKNINKKEPLMLVLVRASALYLNTPTVCEKTMSLIPSGPAEPNP
jgi:hypothetical protein